MTPYKYKVGQKLYIEKDASFWLGRWEITEDVPVKIVRQGFYMDFAHVIHPAYDVVVLSENGRLAYGDTCFVYESELRTSKRMKTNYYTEAQTPGDDETIEEFVNRFLVEGIPEDFWEKYGVMTDGQLKALWCENIILALANRMNIDPFPLLVEEDED